MNDQAKKLREIVKRMKEHRTNALNSAARIITVTSGKGGVGKTSFTVNLAICLSEMGYRILIIDGDFGLANIDVMLGVIPKYDLSHVITHRMKFEDIVTEGPCGIKFISGGSGVNELIKMNSWQLESLAQEIVELDNMADIILIDTGAGLSENVLRMVMAANETILITTPEPTAITDAYALAKTAVTMNRDIRLKLIVNKAENTYEAREILSKFIEVAKRFLDIQMDELGYMVYDPNVPKSVKQQKPFILGFPKSHVSKQIRTIAEALIIDQSSVEYQKQGMAVYIRRLAKLVNRNYFN